MKSVNFNFLFFFWCMLKSLRLYLTLCDPVNCNPPGSSVHGNLQAWILEWVAMPSSRGSSWPRDRTCISYVCQHWQVCGFFTTSATWEAPLFLWFYIYIYKCYASWFRPSPVQSSWIGYMYGSFLGFPGGASDKEPTCQCRQL